MSFPPFIRSFVPLIVGLAVGGIGAFLFIDSMPGKEGSPQEHANQLEVELKRAQMRIAALEASNAAPRPASGVLGKIIGSSRSEGEDHRRTLTDGARRIAEDIREGRPVSPEDVFRASQPLMRDLAPLFDRMRVRQQQQIIDSMTGELARKYDLTPHGQQLLKQWFEKKSAEEAKRWSELIARDGTRLEDVMRASRDVRPDEGLDAFMPSVLSGDKLLAFQSQRTAERAQRVEQEADGMVQRLDSIVSLDETQRDQVFGIMARGSRDYDPRMVIEGTQGEINAISTGNRQAAMLAVLRPEQRAAYEVERQRRREEASKDMEAMGLALPPNWDPLEFDADFR